MNKNKSSDNESCMRKSGIELLKCIAIFLIVISHLLPISEYNNDPYIIDISIASENVNIIICTMFRYLGQLGNAVFIICSSWFLVDSSRCKPEKVLNLLGNNLLVSLIFVCIFILIGVDITFKELIKSFFPTLLANNWFVTCYIIFYLIHPFLNMILNQINQRQLLTINIFGITFYCLLQMIKSGILFYNYLIGFIVLYFITAYMKKYLNNFCASVKYNLITAILSVFGLITIILATNYLGLRIDVLNDKMLHWKIFTNPLVVAFSLSMFNIFSNMKLRSYAVNYVSSLSIMIYVIHENILLRTYTRPYVFKKIYEYTVNIGVSYENNIAWICLCTAIITFMLSIIAASLCHFTVEKLVIFFQSHICKKYTPVFSKLISELCKIK